VKDGPSLALAAAVSSRIWASISFGMSVMCIGCRLMVIGLCRSSCYAVWISRNRVSQLITVSSGRGGSYSHGGVHSEGEKIEAQQRMPALVR
jgi:hypothetical protein